MALLAFAKHLSQLSMAGKLERAISRLEQSLSVDQNESGAMSA
jgi:hypothetical protein